MTEERKGKEFWNACSREDLYKVKEIFNQFNQVIYWRNLNHQDFTGLHIACERGHAQVVEYLISLPQIQENQKLVWSKTPFDCM